MKPAGSHPFIPSAGQAERAAMLDAIGVNDVAELYASIPDRLLLRQPLRLPEPLRSEQELSRHIHGLLQRNTGSDRLLNFLGAGCWQHYVPALCDEIAERAEFLTAYWANAYSDHGKYQAFFEYASLLGELVEMDAVSLPTYDWGSAVGVSLRMAARITGRSHVVVPRWMAPERTQTVQLYCSPDLYVEQVDTEPLTGLLDLDALECRVSEDTAAVYVENPSYIGAVEARAGEIVEIAHAAGALCVMGVDPASLGVIEPPGAYSADFACGDLQPLGMHMQFGGGLAGFIATPDEERFIAEYPTFLIGLTRTTEEGEYGYGLVAWERTSYVGRELGKDFGGTTTGLWAITAAVYLSLLGPHGMRELGEVILQRSRYAALALSEIPGVSVPSLARPHFKEFVVNFDGTGQTVRNINHQLLQEGILGGKDLSQELPELGQSALFCVTEVHSSADIDRLEQALRRALARS